jgi:hypothetical protein
VDSRVGSDAGVEADTARKALETAGIPCCLDFCEGRLRKMVRRRPIDGAFWSRANSICPLRTHLEMLSDHELCDAKPHDVFCGLIDRIARVDRVYNDELARRGLLAK